MLVRQREVRVRPLLRDSIVGVVACVLYPVQKFIRVGLLHTVAAATTTPENYDSAHCISKFQ